MKLLLRICLIFLISRFASGQEIDNLIILKQINGDIPCSCQNQHWHNSGLVLSSADSLTKCFYTLTFETNKKQYWYNKTFNLRGDIVSEGPVIKVKSKPRIFTKQTFELHKQGLWKYYNDEKKISLKRHSCHCDKKTTSDSDEEVN